MSRAKKTVQLEIIRFFTLIFLEEKPRETKKPGKIPACIAL